MKIALQSQLDLSEFESETNLDRTRCNGRSGAFVDNMSLPMHRWFRYSAGFSADWVRSFVRERRENSNAFAVLDPFGGVGTALLACDAERVGSLGFEAHPFIHRVASAKLNGLHVDISRLHTLFQRFVDSLDALTLETPSEIPSLLAKCYTSESLSMLIAMREMFLREFDLKTSESELLWLALTAILRQCSGAGTAPWQYILPNKQKVNVPSPLTAFKSKSIEILEDLENARRQNWSAKSRILNRDARERFESSDLEFDAIVTSPPYPNNYDYADATRLEMTFWGEIGGWGDLQNAVRQHLIRSCSQHAAAEKLALDDLLSEAILDPIRDDLSTACLALAEIRETKGGRKNYHTMAAAYFRDLGLTFKSLRPLCKTGATICFVIGDSAPYGVYLNVDEWLGNLALSAGFKSYSFEKIRDRNTKWKNRKHRVPLKEGRLWIEG